jgi:hypothetical protein
LTLPIKFVLYFGLTIVGALLAAKPSIADDYPIFCRMSESPVWYFQVGISTFKIDNPEIDFHGQLSNDSPIAKQNSGPIGCRSNPQRLVSIYFLGWPIIEKTSGTHYPKMFNYIELYKYPNKLGLHPGIDPDLYNRQTQLASCQNKKFLMRFADGTILCSNSPTARNALAPSNLGKPPVDSDFDYLLSANLYRTPLGEPFGADYSQNDLEIEYLSKLDLIVRYGYAVPPDISEIKSSYIIEVDQIFRSFLNKIDVSQ